MPAPKRPARRAPRLPRSTRRWGSASNPFLTDAIRNQLTFVNGTAQVNVSRSLAELGLVTYDTERNTLQVQGGLRGPLTPRSSGTSMPSMAARRRTR
jgi:hypothetical protein